MEDCRLLTFNDRKIVYNLIRENASYLSENLYADMLNSFEYRLSEQEDSILIGAFSENTKIKCIFGVCFWSMAPYTTLDFMLTSRSVRSGVFDPIKSGIGACLNLALIHAEERGYYTHYSCRRVQEIKLEYKRKIWREYQKKYKVVERYEGFNECFVKSGERPEYSLFWNIMGNCIYPYDVVIRSIKLKNNYRLGEILFSSEGESKW